MSEEEELTPEEMEELNKYLSNVPMREEKTGILHFFNKILKLKDTSKGSYLNENELFAIRTYKSAALYANQMNLKLIGDYLDKEAEIIAATSLGKDGFLIKQVVTQKKELTAKTASEKKKKWLQSKKEEENG
jgi:hypothetical protein